MNQYITQTAQISKGKSELLLTAENEVPEHGHSQLWFEHCAPDTQIDHICFTKAYCGAQVQILHFFDEFIDHFFDEFIDQSESWAGHMDHIFSHLAEKMCTAVW